MKSLSLIFVLFMSVVSFASGRVTDGKVKHTIEKDKITINIEKGFHINTEAPINLKFYVCDDKKTVCEQHEIKPAIKK